MNDAQVEQIALPEPDVVEVPEGRISLFYIAPGRVGVHSGKDVGWLSIDGEDHYVTTNFVLAGEEWGMDPSRSAVCQVQDGKAGARASDRVASAALAVLERAFTDWVKARPDLAARVDVCMARAAVFRTENEIRRLEEAAANLRSGLDTVIGRRDEAEAALETVLANMQPAVPRGA